MKTRRLNWRSLAQQITNDEDLHFPDVQKEHPLVKELAKLVYWNALSEQERADVERYFITTGRSPMSEKDIYKIVKKGKIDKAELIELLFTGLLDDVGYQDYEETKAKKPNVNAKEYFEFMKHTEKDPAVLKMARVFGAILDEEDIEEEYIYHISRQEFESMKHDVEWVKNNLKAIEKSKRLWGKKE